MREGCVTQHSSAEGHSSPPPRGHGRLPVRVTVLKTRHSFRKGENKYWSWPWPSNHATSTIFDHIIPTAVTPSPRCCLDVRIESWPASSFLRALFLLEQQMAGTFSHLSPSPMPLDWPFSFRCVRMKLRFTSTSPSPVLYPHQQVDTGVGPAPNSLTLPQRKESFSFLSENCRERQLQLQQGGQGEPVDG